MLHLRGTRLCIPSVTGVGHRIFALLWKPELFLGLSILLRCCKFCHRTSPSPIREHVRLHVHRGVLKEPSEACKIAWICQVGSPLQHASRRAATEDSAVVVVEGFFDCMKVHQAGIPSTTSAAGRTPTSAVRRCGHAARQPADHPHPGGGGGIAPNLARCRQRPSATPKTLINKSMPNVLSY
jgi:hypothetical protein